MTFVFENNCIIAWVFPSLCNINAASAITAMLKELAHRVDALHPDVCATDIPVGSCNDIVNAEGERQIFIAFPVVSGTEFEIKNQVGYR